MTALRSVHEITWPTYIPQSYCIKRASPPPLLEIRRRDMKNFPTYRNYTLRSYLRDAVQSTPARTRLIYFFLHARTLSPPEVAESRSSLLVLAVKSGNTPPKSTFATGESKRDANFSLRNCYMTNPLRLCHTSLDRSISSRFFFYKNALSRQMINQNGIQPCALRPHRHKRV